MKVANKTMTEEQARQKINLTVAAFWSNRACQMFHSATTCNMGTFIPKGIANLKITKDWPLKPATFTRLADGAKMKMHLQGNKFKITKS